MDEFTKQPYEEFVISGDFVNVLVGTESIIAGSSDITAIDTSTEQDSTTEVVDIATKTVSGSQLRVRCQAGDDGEDHKITFRVKTTQDNKFEIDVLMHVVET